MNKNTSGKKSSQGLFTGLLCALGGIAVGVGAKFLYDEINNDRNQPAVNRGEKNSENLKTKDDKENNKEFVYPTTVPIDMDIEYESFVCPITQEIMKDPVITPHGISYERSAIVNWLEKNESCPFTKKNLKKEDLITNYALKCSINQYLKKISSNNPK